MTSFEVIGKDYTSLYSGNQRLLFSLCLFHFTPFLNEFSDAQRSQGVCLRSHRNYLVDAKSENPGLLLLPVKLPKKAGSLLQENQRLLQVGKSGFSSRLCHFPFVRP